MEQTADESLLDNTTSSKRSRKPLMLLRHPEPLQAVDEDEEIGLNSFDSRDLMEGAEDITLWTMPQPIKGP